MSQILKWQRLCKPTAHKLPEVSRLEIVVLCLYMVGSVCFFAGSFLTLMHKLLP